MPPKKLKWGDIPNLSKVMDKDVNGKWIHCKMCDVRIKIRSQFSFIEWNMHTDGVNHNELANSKALKNIPKLTKFFKKRKDITNSFPQKIASPKKRPKIITYPGFHYDNNSDLVHLYAKYKKR